MYKQAFSKYRALACKILNTTITNDTFVKRFRQNLLSFTGWARIDINDSKIHQPRTIPTEKKNATVKQAEY